MTKSLRADITGLRAIAVIAVALFHVTHVFNPDNSYFTGGFLGVDIFFVISGYLMTMIIVSGIEKNSFSLWDFYKRRAKRICPALFVVVALSLAAAFVVFNLDFIRANVLRESLVSLGFVSNFRFARELDYFDKGDFSHLFLHTWSLSVEWQFYIFYPVLLMLAKRFVSIKSLGFLVLIATVITFITSIVWTELNPRQSYFMLPSRACELLAGALAFFYPLSSICLKLGNKLQQANPIFSESASKLFELVGLILISISFFIIDDKNGWPTALMVLPIFGTWLCIAACNTDSWLKSVLFQKIGIWSYSIYLVHWPIIVLASSLGLSGYGFYWLIPIVLLGIILHYSIEKRRNYGKIFAIAYFSLAGFIYVADANKLIYRLNTSSLEFYVLDGNQGFKGGTTVQVGNKPEFIVHGDSHSLDLVKPMIERDYSFIINSTRGCYSFGKHVNPYIEIAGRDDSSSYECSILYTKLKDISASYPTIPIVFQFNWPIYGNNYTSDLNLHFEEYHRVLLEDVMQVAIDLHEHDIYIVGRRQGNPLHDSGKFAKQSILSLWANKLLLSYSNMPKQIEYTPFRVNESLKQAISIVEKERANGTKLAHITYVDPDVYCKNNMCDLFIDDQLQIYSDGNHYSWAGAEKSVSHLLEVMGIARGKERTDFSEVPDIDFYGIQKELPYSEQDGFKLDK